MIVIIFLAPTSIWKEVVGDLSGTRTDNNTAAVRASFLNGEYETAKPIDVSEMSPEDAAEEMFDLTNNPARCQERSDKYGHLRSVSTGDVICAGGKFLVCLSVGWAELK